MEWAKIKNLIKLCLIKGGMDTDAVSPYCKAAGMPKAASYAAELLWIEKVPEDKNTEALRKQLKALKRTGLFDITE